MYFLFLLLFGILFNDSLSLLVEKLNSGFVLENIGYVTPIRGKYIFEIIFDASTVSTGFLKEIETNMTNECNVFKSAYRDHADLSLKCDQWKIVWSEKKKQYMDVYNSVFDQSFKILKSKKRRDLNWFSEYFGSYVGDWYFNTVFGLMSHDDRRRQDQINSKFSSSIVDVYLKINRSAIFSEKLAENMNKNTAILNHVSAQLRKVMMKNERYNTIDSLMEISNELFTLCFARLVALSDITRDLQKGFLSPKLVKDSDLIQEMKTVSLDINEELYINTTISDYNKILSLKKFGARWINKTLHILLPIPVIDRDIFELIKIHPVPQVKNDIAMAIDITTDYMIVSKDKSRYSKISKNNLLTKNGDCLIFEDRFYCEGITTFRTEEKSCIKNILTEKNSSICKLRAASITDALVIPIKPNTFIITVPRRIQAKLVYTNRTVINLFFEGSTLIANEAASTY